MSGGPSPWDIAAFATATCGGVWAGIKWLFGRADRREKALDAKEAELVSKLEKRVDALEQDNRKIWSALAYVVPALHALDPRSPALKQAAKILGNAFPIPADMTDTLNKIG